MYLESLVIFVCINMIAVGGLALLTGYTGIFSCGHAGFMSIGAYASVVLFRHLGVPYVFAILLGGVAAMLIGLLIGYPALRNKMEGDAFAICMIGFTAVVRVVLSNTKTLINGALGISGIPKLSSMWAVLGFTVVLIYLLHNYIRSDYGKNCIAIAQQEPAAEMVGINVLKTKVTSLAISAFYGGVAGGLYAFFATFLSPSTFAEAKSDDLLAAVVLGGICSMSGPLAAAAVLIVIPEVLRFLALWRLVFYGLAFVLIMQFKPEGLMGYREFDFSWVGKLYKKIRGKTDESNAAAKN